MEDKRESISAEESLGIITNMIQQTRFNVNQGSFHLIFWGILIASIAISHYTLGLVGMGEKGGLVWLLTIPGAIVSLVYGLVTGKNARISTYADVLYSVLWISFAVVMFSGLTLLVMNRVDGALVAAYSMLMAAYATYMSGWILKFQPLKFGGMIFFLAAWLCFLLGGPITLLISAAAVIGGYIIPGVMLKKKG